MDSAAGAWTQPHLQEAPLQLLQALLPLLSEPFVTSRLVRDAGGGKCEAHVSMLPLFVQHNQ